MNNNWEERGRKRSWTILMFLQNLPVVYAESSPDLPTEIRTKGLQSNYDRLIRGGERETNVFITGSIHDSMGYVCRDSWLIISTRPSSQRNPKDPDLNSTTEGIQLQRPAPPS
jgi:hypothetical protein